MEQKKLLPKRIHTHTLYVIHLHLLGWACLNYAVFIEMKYSISLRFQLHGLFIISSEIVGNFRLRVIYSECSNENCHISAMMRKCRCTKLFSFSFYCPIFQRRPMCPRIYLIFLFLIEWLQIIRNAMHHLYFMSGAEKAKQMFDVFQQLNSSRKLNHALHLLFISFHFHSADERVWNLFSGRYKCIIN